MRNYALAGVMIFSCNVWSDLNRTFCNSMLCLSACWGVALPMLPHYDNRKANMMIAPPMMTAVALVMTALPMMMAAPPMMTARVITTILWEERGVLIEKRKSHKSCSPRADRFLLPGV